MRSCLSINTSQVIKLMLWCQWQNESVSFSQSISVGEFSFHKIWFLCVKVTLCESICLLHLHSSFRNILSTCSFPCFVWLDSPFDISWQKEKYERTKKKKNRKVKKHIKKQRQSFQACLHSLRLIFRVVLVSETANDGCYLKRNPMIFFETACSILKMVLACRLYALEIPPRFYHLVHYIFLHLSVFVWALTLRFLFTIFLPPNKESVSLYFEKPKKTHTN